jgi:hypothetical protein
MNKIGNASWSPFRIFSGWGDTLPRQEASKSLVPRSGENAEKCDLQFYEIPPL